MKLNNDNFLSEGTSGKIGDVVFYQRYGKTFMRKAPGSYNKVATARQAMARARFVEAHKFAQGIINDPVLKAAYHKKAKGHCYAYNKAISEYLLNNDHAI